MLKVGGLTLGGLAAPDLLCDEAVGANRKKSISTGKSVIFLLQHGGPTQFETFDPKLDIPDSKRTVGGVVQTSVPGLMFGSTLKRLSKLAHRLAIVRSYTTGSANHSLQPLIGKHTGKANIGTLYSRLAGANDAQTGIPANVALFPNTIDPKALGPDERFGKFTQTGNINSAFAPFVPGGGSTLQDNMKQRLPASRLDDRAALLASLDALRRDLDGSSATKGVDKYRQQAFEMILRGVANAFDLSKEDPRTIARYDTSHFISETRYKHVSNGNKRRRWYQNNAHTLGKELLLARRLCEAGCRFVTVATRFVWDMHADQNNLGVTQGMEAVGQPFDHAVSAFIEDCEKRGLRDDILLVCVGEMGRTPRINKRGGRDHWAGLAPMMLYGGGMTHGQVIGQSTRDGGQPLSDKFTSTNLIATILHTLLDIGEVRLRTELPTELVNFVTTSTPIRGLGL